MLTTEWIKAFLDLSFPVAVAVYLLIFQSKQMDRLTKAQNDVRLGLYLILAKLEMIEQYREQIEQEEIKEKMRRTNKED